MITVANKCRSGLFAAPLFAVPLLSATLLLAGCADMGNIKPQSAQQQVDQLALSKAMVSVGAEAGWPQRHWWENYADAQLNRLVTTAVAGNPSMAVAAARVRQARSMAEVTHAGELPQLGFNASIARDDWSKNIYYGATLPGKLTWNNTATLGLSYGLDLWDKDRNNTERAIDEVHAAAADARAAQLDLESNVVRTYVYLALQYGLLDNATSTLAEEQRILQFAQRRLKGGIGTQMEITQAEVPLPETRRQMEALQENIALTRNQLAALLGQGPGAGDSIMRPSLTLHAVLSLPSQIPSELIGRRPDISAARWRVEAASKGIEVAKASFYPNVNLAASFGPVAAGGGMLSFLNARNFSTVYGPAVSLPIFDGGRLRGQLSATTASYDLAVEQYNQLLSQALKTIADQIVTLQSLVKQQELADQSVAAAQKNVNIATRAYQRGLTSYLNVLTAQTQYLHQLQTVQQLQAQKLSAFANLTTALGGGLDADIIPAPQPAPAEIVDGVER